jgi:hypothetical protein
MKKLAIFSFIFFLYSNIYCQKVKDFDSLKIDDFYIDFAVPDLSAYNLLGLKSENVIKPSSFKELAISLFDFNQQGEINPKLGLEWSPLYTLKPETKSILDYRNKYQFYSLQISLASNIDSLGNRFCFGINWTPIDKSNPLLSTMLGNDVVNDLCNNNVLAAYEEFDNKTDDFINKIIKIINAQNTKSLTNLLEIDTDKYKPPVPFNIEAEYKRVFDEINKIQPNTQLTIEQQKELEEICEQYILLVGMKYDSEKNASKKIAALKGKFKKENWNAEIFKISSALILNSADSTWKNMKSQKWSSYAVYSHPLSKNGQFILNLQYSYFFNQDTNQDIIKDSYIKSNLFAGARVLFGNNENRISLEGSYAYFTKSDKNLNEKIFRFTMGTEIRITEGLWIEFATGMYNSNINGNKFSPYSFGQIKYALQKQRRFEIQ